VTVENAEGSGVCAGPSTIEGNLIAAFDVMQLAHLSPTCLAQCEEVTGREAHASVIMLVRRIDGD
jgi:hypothetical protein